MWKLPFAYLSALILFVAGIGILLPHWQIKGARLAAIWVGLWALLLHLPHVVTDRNVGALLGLAEAVVSALGLATLASCVDLPRRTVLLRSAVGLCLVIFGASHFAYADITASMVPAWLPDRLGLAYLIGAIHVLDGACLLAGIRVRLAMTIEALMMSSFVLLVHMSGVAAAPHDRLQLTMFGMAGLLTTAAWLVANWKGLRSDVA